MIRWLVGVVALGVALPGATAAQSADVLIDEGIAAYRDLDYAAAAGLLRRAVEHDSLRVITGERRARVLMYLGAAELFGERRDRAAAVFRALVTELPTFRPDTLVFPPRVVAALEEALATTKAAGLNVPARYTFVAGDSAMPLGVSVTSAHVVTVVLEDAEARAIATLYDGRVEDSVTIGWSGRDAGGSVVPPGRYRIRAVSAATPGTALRSVAVPLTVQHNRVPALSPPQFPVDSLRDERTGGPRLPLAVSAIGLGALALAPLVFGDTNQRTPRLVIGGGVALAGLVELVSRRGKPTPENVTHNAQIRAQYENELARIERVNERRAQLIELDVRAGVPERREGG